MKVSISTHLLQGYFINHSLTVPPLFAIEFLHRVVDIFTDYFGECNEQRIKEHYVIVYEVRETLNKLCLDAIFLQLLEEMLDNGFPLATESNILKELIRPPTVLPTNMINSITGKSK